MEYGCIQIYYGDGKGKTTAGMGQSIRLAGYGKEVLVYQFLKDNHSSELNILKQIPNVTLKEGRDSIKFSFQLTKEEEKEYQKYYQEALYSIIEEGKSDKYSGIFVDEILTCLKVGYIQEEDVLRLIDVCQGRIELIMTGHYLPEAISQRADYISHIKKIKHPFDRGLRAREGIEV